MNARALNALAGVICRAQENGRRTPMGIAIAVESAGMLQSPESAAELERLTVLLREVQAIARRRRLEAQGREAHGKRLKTENTALLVERAKRNIVLHDVQMENAEFRARIPELDALVESMCAALTGHDCPDPTEGPMATATRTAIRLMEAEARVAELEAAARPAILDLPPSRVTRRALAGMGAPVEDPHDSPLDRAYLVGRDLDVSVSRFMPKRDALCVCGHTGLDHHHAGFACWAHLPRGPRASMAEPLPPVEICGCKAFAAAGPGEQL